MPRLTALLLALATLVSAGSAAAYAPERSVRPAPREAVPAFTPRTVTVPVYYRAAIRPMPRPAAATPAPAAAPSNAMRDVARASRLAVGRSLRPSGRPGEARVQPASAVRAVPQRPGGISGGGKVGAICGDRAIQGRAVAPIQGRVRGCGVDRPVAVTAVDGVRLSQAAVMDCGTAKALKSWVRRGLKPEVGRLGGGVDRLQVAAHYVCRTRNHQPGARISEHGRGRAIDISAIVLKNGARITVEQGWKRRAEGRLLRRVHKAACGPFGTVLGPEADRHHRDHFHFDTARHRGGAYCR
ncbi:extensin family protein [Rhodovulum sp. YNF3179]|uniref:extensin-like domain-containing protein n=1 Tax=Rhodovulum sp. YNF3179 TaxID=3425127 RepID=UPI003D34769C